MLEVGSALGRVARAAATALALGAAVGVADAADARPAAYQDNAPIQVRRRPPKPKPTTRIIDCKVTAIKPAKKGKKGMAVHATCPTYAGIGKGDRGQLLDAKYKPIKGGLVVVTGAKKGKVEGVAAALKGKVKAPKLRFRVHF